MTIRIDYMDTAALAGTKLQSGQVAKFAEHGSPTVEAFSEASQWEVDLLAAADGAIGPGILLRGPEGEPMAGKLLDASEGMELGKLLLTNSYLTLRRLAEEGQDWAEDALRRHLKTVIRDVLPEFLVELQANARMQAVAEMVEAEAARKLVLEHEVRDKVRRQEREKILHLARAAAAVDPGDRARRLQEAKPWLVEIAAAD